MKGLIKGRLFFCFVPRAIILFLFSGCTSSSRQPVLKEGPYFSLASYFYNEALRCEANTITLRKSVTKDGITENKVIADPSWTKEFSLFSECDLNRKAWEKLYRADTIQEGSGKKIRYLSADSSLQVKRVEILLMNDSVLEISMERRFRNFYYQSDLTLLYKPNWGFTISGSQSIRFFRNHRFEMQGRFMQS